MKPLSDLPHEQARWLRGLVFDLDDTFLSKGVLTLEAYAALWALADAGLELLVATGRPSAWGEVMARQWPVRAFVSENGAVAAVREGPGVARFDRVPPAERRARRIRLAQIVEDVRDQVPEARLTDDVDGRLTDVTWDIGERVRLPSERVQLLEEVIRAAGARTFRSSVHVHATFDTEDKASGVLAFLAAHGMGEDEAKARYAFVGDSGNDAACFEAFAVTVGVANVASHIAALPVPPVYVTPSPYGKGFAELAAALLEARR